ncbi:hypothetical protein [Citrobacter sp. CF971]|nr:hypothetical protein [Citrobacter sp. CF971]
MKSNAKLSLLALSLALGTSLAYASDDIPIVPASVMKKDVPAYVSSGQVTNEVMGSVNENPVLTMKPGVNQIIPIAIGHPNRVVTPFGNRNMDSKRKDTARFFRREPVMIVNPETKAKVLRYAMGNPGNLSITKLAVALDYDAVDVLGVRFKDTVNLEVRRARRWEVWQWFWNHPDQSVQLSIKLGVVGAVLGVMGFLTGVAPFLLG